MKRKIGIILMATVLLLSLVCIASCGGDEKFKVTFVDWDDTVIEIDEVDPNAAATPPDDPTREGYVFSGWDVSFDEVTGDITVKATYTEIPPVVYHAVRFVDYDEATVLKTESVEDGKAAIAPAAPTREGYRFTGWDKDFSKITADTVIKATYVKTFTVTFKNDDGTVIKTEKVDANGSATAPTATKEGYTFEKWDKAFTNVTNDLTVTAIYVEKVEVTFIYKDENNKEKKIAVVSVDKGSDATAPKAPERAGYRFDKWDKEFKKVTAALKVEAIYVRQFTVTFKNDDGTVLKTVKVDKGGDATKEAPTATKTGYTFDKWVCAEKDQDLAKVEEDIVATAVYIEKCTVRFVYKFKKDGTDTEIEISKVIVDKGTSFVTPPENPTLDGYIFEKWEGDYTNIQGDVTITAKFRLPLPSYIVKFVDYNGAVLKNEGVEEGSAATAPTVPTREGYRFTGWDKDFSNVTADLTVTAQYVQQFTVTFKDYDGKVLKTEPVDINGNATEKAPTPTRTGYRFTDWDNNISKITADLTVTAQYVQQFTVTFKDHDGTVIGTPQQVEEGSAATAPADPTREGYDFDGWDGEYDNVQADVTVTAKYKVHVDKYTVTFVDWDNNVLSSQEVEKGGSATAPADPTRDGYNFTGWDKTAEELSNITADLEVTATYEEIPAVQSPTLSVTNASGAAGETVTVTVSVENNTEAQLNFTITCSDPISLNSAKKAQDLLVSKKSNSNVVTVSSTSAINGDMFTLTFQIAEGAAAGTYEFSISGSGDLSASGTITVN